jgi:hypothetical protein
MSRHRLKQVQHPERRSANRLNGGEKDAAQGPRLV